MLRDPCGLCYGTGTIRCLTCGGTGIRRDSSLLNGDCFKCRGTGEAICLKCAGSGLINAAMLKAPGQDTRPFGRATERLRQRKGEIHAEARNLRDGSRFQAA